MLDQQARPRQVAWRAGLVFEAPDQQQWWDGLDDDQRLMAVQAAPSPADTPTDAAVRARILELQLRRQRATRPRWLLGVVVVLLATCGLLLAAGGTTVALAGLVGGVVSALALLLVTGAARRRRHEAMAAHRSQAAAARMTSHVHIQP